jgi:eukaryotic-like serine/threonine-protein kinase
MAKRATERLIANRYARERILGRGGMGVVWRARDQLLGRDVAIKEVQLPPSLTADDLDAMRARVLREARAAARLNHPNVVTLYDVVQEEGRTFIVMELVEAPTLSAVVKERGPLPPAEVAAIGVQVLDALRAAHRVGIVHRDVKPGNVMVPSGDERVKLADFGIASLAGDPQLTATGLVLGSPAYMAPEQASGQPSGPATDLWALGATMYFALEGEPPFERNGAVPTLTAVVNDPPRRMQRGGELEPLVLGLLTKSPAERPSAGQLRGQLQRLGGSAPGSQATTAVVPPATAAHDTAPMPVVPPSPPVEHAAPSEPAEPAAAEPAEPVSEASEPAAGQPVPAAAPPSEAATAPVPHGESGPEPAPDRPAAHTGSGERMEAAPPPSPSARSGQGPVLPVPTPVTPRSRPRAALVLALGLALAGGLVVAVLLGAFRADRGGETPAGKGGPAASAPTTTATTPRTTTPRTTAAGGGQTATTAPQQGGAAAPAGFKLLENPQGHYAVAYPEGWNARVLNSRFNTAIFRDGKTERSFEIRSQTPPAELLPASRDWEKTQRQRRDSYHLIGQNEGTYQGKPAVITEYTYQDKGERLHERHVNFAIGDWGYSVVMTARGADWAAADREVWRTVEQTFRAA